MRATPITTVNHGAIRVTWTESRVTTAPKTAANPRVSVPDTARARPVARSGEGRSSPAAPMK
jgi:hypothetical protein